MKQILFVDDEPKILEGLRRMLRPMRNEWAMTFATSGQEALDLMAKTSFDLIVSDMRMPKMDGSTLLTEVMKRYPKTVRFVLSGQSDEETIFRSVGSAHQFMAKPCDADVLKATVNRAFTLRGLLNSENVRHLVSQMPALPPLPKLYQRLMDELRSPDCSIQAVGQIIESDVAMIAKILQWTNSAFFGIRQHVSNPVQAVSLLGLDTIRGLALMVGAFSRMAEAKLPPGFSFDGFCQHSMAVGAYAQAISNSEHQDDKDVSDAFTGAVLHDSGMLVFAANWAAQYGDVLSRTQNSPVPLTDAEVEAFGCTHAEVGGYLLGLWGLPDPVVEAVAFHHRPADCPAQRFSPLTAVHVANCLEHETQRESGAIARPEVELDYLRQLGLENRLSAWRDVCLRISERRETQQ